MDKFSRHTIKLVFAALALVVCFGVTATSTQATPLTVNGTTQGNFDGGTPATNASLNYTGVLGLTFSALDFQGQAFSTSVPTDGVTPAIVTVGGLDLRALRNFDFTGHTFSLVVTFTAPPVSGGNPAAFTATLSGVITANEIFDGNESITINFDNTPQVFSFAGGTFSFSVLDVVVHEQADFVSINGEITATETPEPLSMLLLGTGLSGVAMKLRKRRRVK